MNVKFIELYINKFIKGKIDFDGIILIPTIEKDGHVSWEIKNPNNVSFTRFALKGKIESSIEDFFEITGDPISAYIKRDINGIQLGRRSFIEKNFIDLGSIPNIFISNEMKSDIKRKIFDEVRLSYMHHEMTIKGFDWFEFETYHEEITFSARVKIYDVLNKQTGKLLNNNEIFAFLNKIWNNGDDGDFNDSVLYGASRIIYTTPTLYDRDESYLRVLANFYTKDGESIRYWD